jgi:predicted oxidoreductase
MKTWPTDREAIEVGPVDRRGVVRDWRSVQQRELVRVLHRPPAVSHRHREQRVSDVVAVVLVADPGQRRGKVGEAVSDEFGEQAVAAVVVPVQGAGAHLELSGNGP